MLIITFTRAHHPLDVYTRVIVYVTPHEDQKVLSELPEKDRFNVEMFALFYFFATWK